MWISGYNIDIDESKEKADKKSIRPPINIKILF